MIDLRKKYQTRDGRQVVLRDKDGSLPCTVRGFHENRQKGGWDEETWTDTGRFDPWAPQESCFDLVEVPDDDSRRKLAKDLAAAALNALPHEIRLRMSEMAEAHHTLMLAAIERVLEEHGP